MRISFGRLAAIPLMILATVACANMPQSVGADRPADRNLLMLETIRTYSNAHEAVQTLRSDWMRARNVGDFRTLGQVTVYRDGVKLGGPEVLRRMATQEIASIEYFDGIRASGRWGLGHENGVILVHSRMR